MAVYYNEIDPYAAQWLRNLIAAGHIAAGDVDERSIDDVRPADLRGYTRCHFFAGIGVWDYALALAGYPADQEVWTGSCPCQPFSSAGKGAGFADERHLWPAWFHLIEQCRPAVVFGEQVASNDAEPWIDLVQDDLEGLGYAVGAIPFPAAGVGAPHIRDRLYWVANANGRSRRKGRSDIRGWADRGDAQSRPGLGGCGMPDRMGDPERKGLALSQRVAGISRGESGTDTGEAVERASVYARWLADADGWNASAEWQQRSREHGQQPKDGGAVHDQRAGPTNGLWRAADWLLCRDGRWRPVEPGTSPLAAGVANRVGRLRAYGNGLCAEAAAAFIASAMECM